MREDAADEINDILDTIEQQLRVLREKLQERGGAGDQPAPHP